MREERGTILFCDVSKKCGFIVPSSGGDKSDNVSIGSAELAQRSALAEFWRLYWVRSQAPPWAFC